MLRNKGMTIRWNVEMWKNMSLVTFSLADDNEAQWEWVWHKVKIVSEIVEMTQYENVFAIYDMTHSAIEKRNAL